MFERGSGVLLHPTSLPGPYGIGDLGTQAHRWVDFLAESGCALWQVLPLGPTGYGDSPYQCFSAFAGNPYLISPRLLLEEGLLHENDLIEAPRFPAGFVDYGRVIPWKLNLLERAFTRFREGDFSTLKADFDSFRAAHAAWLDDYALFMALKEAHGGAPWDRWPDPVRRRDPSALSRARRSLEPATTRFAFYQFLFFRQWFALKDHAARRGVRIIGDIPIFVAHDSADVWAHPELFCLDQDGRPTHVAGVPPDYFSPTGQLWGNPLYRWEAHRQEGYTWWLARFRATLAMVDIVRLDHFRGFAAYWEIPAGEPTAERGRWVDGPGESLFLALERALTGEASPPVGAEARLPIIAEDLGVITPDVVALREKFRLPGMKVLQFAFSGPENPFLPHRYPRDCVVYTGTHDNDTTRGWYESAPQAEREFARRYLGREHLSAEAFVWELIRLAWASVAVFAVAPMQDLLALGTEARMNYPSRPSGNWRWRMREEALTDDLCQRLREVNHLYARGMNYR